jgi:Zn finger protein HypA/HybF involved in hydrogenase expression
MRNRYTRDILEPIIKESMNWADVCRTLNITTSTGVQSHVKKRAIEFGIDFSHFTGFHWSRGKKFPLKYPIEDYLTNKRFIGSHKLKLLLFEYKIKEKKCERCGLTEWLGEEVVFELDHINGNHEDNRIDNIMIMCPNCHRNKTRKQKKQRIK